MGRPIAGWARPALPGRLVLAQECLWRCAAGTGQSLQNACSDLGACRAHDLALQLEANDLKSLEVGWNWRWQNFASEGLLADAGVWIRY